MDDIIDIKKYLKEKELDIGVCWVAMHVFHEEAGHWVNKYTINNTCSWEDFPVHATVKHGVIYLLDVRLSNLKKELNHRSIKF